MELEPNGTRDAMATARLVLESRFFPVCRVTGDNHGSFLVEQDYYAVLTEIAFLLSVLLFVVPALFLFTFHPSPLSSSWLLTFFRFLIPPIDTPQDWSMLLLVVPPFINTCYN